MPRIKDDLNGVVTATGSMGVVSLRAGEEIPDGVHVHGALTADGVTVGTPTIPTPAFTAAPVAAVEPLSDGDRATARALGVDPKSDPEWVRGFLIGRDSRQEELEAAAARAMEATVQAEGLESVVAALRAQLDAANTEPAGEPEQVAAAGYPPLGARRPVSRADAFDPEEHTVADVAAFLSVHPDQHDRVIAAESKGRARHGILTLPASAGG